MKFDNDSEPVTVLKHELSSSKVNYAKYCPRMLWSFIDIIQKTFENTTQFARTPAGTCLNQFFKLAFPGCSYQHGVFGYSGD